MALRWTRARVGAVVGAALLVLIAVGALIVAQRPARSSTWRASFGPGRDLITNELGARRSDQWLVTSGSLFNDHGAGWTGPIDGHRPDANSAQATDSAVFRAVTQRRDFGNVTVRFELNVARTGTTARTGPHAYDGVHVFLRYQSPQLLYAVSVDRRDSTVAIKVKTPGGPSNGGDYATLAQAPFHFRDGRWVREKVVVANVVGGVRITLWTDGAQLLSITNRDPGDGALTHAGRVGLRGDNTEFRFRDFTVSGRT